METITKKKKSSD